MREIKFRCYNLQEKKMYEQPYARDEWTTEYQPLNAVIESIQKDTEYWSPLMQFTGLLDKNGKEIYEGDILRFPYSTLASGWDVERQGNIMQVIFGSGAFWTKPIDFDDRRFYGLLMTASGMEIVGNIYENNIDENPNLITKQP